MSRCVFFIWLFFFLRKIKDLLGKTQVCDSRRGVEDNNALLTFYSSLIKTLTA
jgi:hypothetical protein